MGDASDVSLEAADVVLMSDDLTVLLHAFEIATFV
jgi:cation transport ATPase